MAKISLADLVPSSEKRNSVLSTQFKKLWEQDDIKIKSAIGNLRNVDDVDNLKVFREWLNGYIGERENKK